VDIQFAKASYPLVAAALVPVIDTGFRHIV
jgi:hypothetical protein